jgi:diadenosine tetraphosphatase ApaH/serine/threonine PP2A family protein phosphatase
MAFFATVVPLIAQAVAVGVMQSALASSRKGPRLGTRGTVEVPRAPWNPTPFGAPQRDDPMAKYLAQHLPDLLRSLSPPGGTSPTSSRRVAMGGNVGAPPMQSKGPGGGTPMPPGPSPTMMV